MLVFRHRVAKFLLLIGTQMVQKMSGLQWHHFHTKFMKIHIQKLLEGGRDINKDKCVP
jgi:hypothetical protein